MFTLSKTLRAVTGALALAAVCAAPALAADKSVMVTSIVEHPALDAVRDGTRDELKAEGYEAGNGFKFEFQSAQGNAGTAGQIAKKFVGDNPDVIVAIGTPSAQPLVASTKTIPIVFEMSSDPIALGLAASLRQPGGNLTGVVTSNVEVMPKRLELLHELLPTAKLIAVLVNPANPTVAATLTRNVEAAGRKLGVEVPILNASTDRELDDAFATLVALRAGGLAIAPDAFFTSRSEQLASLALRNAVPAVYQYGEFVAAGGLMSYGGDLTDAYRLVASYASRILKGDKAADLPVQQTTKVELLINLKTANVLGLNFPLTLLGRADEVIE